MSHFWLIVATSLTLGILLSILTAYVAFEYAEHRFVYDLKMDFDQWLLRDYKIAHKMPWPTTPSFGTGFDKTTALWLIKAVIESYAIRYQPSYKPTIPDFNKKPHRFYANGEFAGYGVLSDDDQTMLLAFHGTSDVADVMQDLKGAEVPFPGSKTARVFQGLFEITENLQKAVLEWLKTTETPSRLFIAGHSSGAAVAVFLGARLKMPTVVYTFASPKLGNHAFQRLVDNKTHHYRIVNAADVVPTMPAGTKTNQYWPSGTPIITYLETGQTSLNHGLSTYAHALETSDHL